MSFIDGIVEQVEGAKEKVDDAKEYAGNVNRNKLAEAQFTYPA